jgi:hypothetical protein
MAREQNPSHLDRQSDGPIASEADGLAACELRNSLEAIVRIGRKWAALGVRSSEHCPWQNCLIGRNQSTQAKVNQFKPSERHGMTRLARIDGQVQTPYVPIHRGHDTGHNQSNEQSQTRRN